MIGIVEAFAVAAVVITYITIFGLKTINPKKQLDKETRNLIIHVSVMFCISLFFMIYFRMVEHDPGLQKQIMDNVTILPPLQLLSYAGYVAYVSIHLYHRFQDKRKINRDLLNVVVLVGKVFHVYVIWMIDLIGITITFIAFFIYSNPNPSEKMLGSMNVSDIYFLIIVPNLTILSHFLISKRKLQYR